MTFPGFVDAIADPDFIVALSGITLLVFLALLMFAAHFGKSRIDLTDLIIDASTKKATNTKFAQLIGLVIGAYVTVICAITDRSLEAVFGLFLTYCAGLRTIQALQSVGEKKAENQPATAPGAPVANIQVTKE